MIYWVVHRWMQAAEHLRLETLVDVWTGELVAGGRIVLETQTIDQGEQRGTLTSGEAPRIIRRGTLRVSERLRNRLNSTVAEHFNL